MRLCGPAVRLRLRGAQFMVGQRRGAVAQGDVKAGGGGGQHGFGQRTRDQQLLHQNSLPPNGTSWPGPISTTSPSASGRPSTSTSDSTLPIWRGGKLTTASTCSPISPSGV